MLFNSLEFIFVFVPLVVAVFHLLRIYGRPVVCMGWLALASLVFYGIWNPIYLWLLLGSIVTNYGLAALISRSASNSFRKSVLWFGITLNLVLLGHFKYSVFLVENVNRVFGSTYETHEVLLPLAISFYTFQKIAFLVDIYRTKARNPSFADYALFVTFFPQLIAGPIVHHREVIPQFARLSSSSFSPFHLAFGITLFLVGLFKKTVLADGIATYSTPMFDGALHGYAPTFVEAWGGALAYAFQIYFDFSGYSDMAIGLGLLFGIILPVNFFSPYKAGNITEFWRRWHMTLSRFLKEHLYFVLGGNHKGQLNAVMAMAVTMVLGGLWHGAHWNFIIWGGLHAAYIAIHRLWKSVRVFSGLTRTTWLGTAFGWFVTMIAVTFAWVFFRAGSLDAAWAIVRGMLGANGVVLPALYAGYLGAGADLMKSVGVAFSDGLLPHFGGTEQILLTVGLLVICLFTPNTAEIFHLPRSLLDRAGNYIGIEPFRPRAWIGPAGAVFVALVGVLALMPLFASSPSEFLYFQF